jgi:hypothetical protein
VTGVEPLDRSLLWLDGLFVGDALAAKLAHVPFWVLAIMSLLPGEEQLRRAGLPTMRYFSRGSEIGDATEANELLGAPTTTLEKWCREAMGGS